MNEWHSVLGALLDRYSHTIECEPPRARFFRHRSVERGLLVEEVSCVVDGVVTVQGDDVRNGISFLIKRA